MSFILDALKKSEQERTRQQPATALDLPYGRQARAPRIWMLAVVGLLLLNFGVLMLLWWRNDIRSATPENSPVSNAAAPAQTSPATSQATALVTAPTTAPTPVNDASSAEVRSLRAEAATHTTNDDHDMAVSALATTTAATGPALVRSTTQPTASAHTTNNSNSSVLSVTHTVDNVPTLDSLGGAAALNLPSLHMDLHVYAVEPKQRFVFINTQRYQIGDRLAEGPEVASITQDGAVLSYQGHRFLLPR